MHSGFHRSAIIAILYYLAVSIIFGLWGEEKGSDQSCGLGSFSVERFSDFVRYPKENISKLELFSFG